VRLSGFEARLIHAGIAVHAIETYDTRAIDYRPDELSAAIGMEPVDAVLLYSARAAHCLRLLDWPQPIRRLLAQAVYLCLSPRVAEELAAAGGSQIRVVAEEPTEAALLRLLGRLED
jgi:uroporphyrinogen-III synthase